MINNNIKGEVLHVCSNCSPLQSENDTIHEVPVDVPTAQLNNQKPDERYK